MMRKIKRRREEIAEDRCFVCKNGGLLMVCDYRDCLKAYHPRCVDKDDSFLDNGSKWTCNSHFCSLCRKASKFKCFCCPKAVCGNCIYDAEFATVKGNRGFCSHCSKLALLIEENVDVDSDGEKVHFKDQDTYECLFSEYYEIIKEEEGLNSQHAYSAHRFFKNDKNKCDLNPDEIGEGEDDTGDSEDVSDFIVSDCDDLNYTARSKSVRKNKGMIKLKSMKGKLKDKKNEFIGWGSRSLIQFLKYIGKDTSKEFSEHDVTSTIIEYCRDNKLFDPKKKRKILCDAQLQSLLGRKSVNRNSIQNLLAPHFAENIKEMDDIRDYNEPFNFSRKRKSISSTKSHHPNLVSEERQSCFAAIVSSNLKLVYLKRSLVDELSKQPEAFDGKVIGSYVRVKSHPHDYLQKNSYLLIEVEGINRYLKNDEINKEIMLQLSNVPKDVPICKISDDDFSEEECQDLCQRMRNGLLKQPTILELEQKARSLHEDIIKHWIPRELVLLQNRIDRANEKGWRRELSEYMDQKLKLETPLEQSRLLNDIPTVIPEIVDSPQGSPRKDKLEQNGLSELATGKTCNSVGRYSKKSGFAHCLNNRTNVKVRLSSHRNTHDVVQEQLSPRQEEDIHQMDEREEERQDDLNPVHTSQKQFQRDANGKIIICPIGRGWTPASIAVEAIRYAITTKFDGPYHSWTDTPEKVRQDWWARFGDKVSWDPRHEEIIRNTFKQHCSKRLTDILTKVRNAGKKPIWIGDEAWAGLVAYWDSEAFRRFSTQNKANRASAKGGAVHTTGRRSHVEVALNLIKKFGRSVGPDELFLATHKKKSGDWVDGRAQRTYEDFQRRLSQMQMQTQIGEASTGEMQKITWSAKLGIWQEVAGGKKRGRVYGTADMSVNLRRGASSLTQESRVPQSNNNASDERTVKMEQRVVAAEERIASLEQQMRTMMERMAALEHQSGSCTE